MGALARMSGIVPQMWMGEEPSVHQSEPVEPPVHGRRADGTETVEMLDLALERYLASGIRSVKDRVEARLLEIAFQANEQNQVRTARALGISRSMLRTLLKRHGLLV